MEAGEAGSSPACLGVTGLGGGAQGVRTLGQPQQEATPLQEQNPERLWHTEKGPRAHFDRTDSRPQVTEKGWIFKGIRGRCEHVSGPQMSLDPHPLSLRALTPCPGTATHAPLWLSAPSLINGEVAATILGACVALTLGFCAALILKFKDLPQVLSGSPGVSTWGSSNVLNSP